MPTLLATPAPWHRSESTNSRQQNLDAHIGLPEVVEAEIPQIQVTRFLEAATSFRDTLKKLRQYSSSLPAYNLPDEETVREEAREQITRLDSRIRRVELTLGLSRAALKRVVEKIAPAKDKEEYRDSLIWESVLELSRTYEVWLITGDGHFFRSGTQTNELAQDLVADCKVRNIEVRAFRALKHCLEALYERWPNLLKGSRIDEGNVAHLIDEGLRRDQLNWRWMVIPGGYEPVALTVSNVHLFPTDQPMVFSVTFILRYEVHDVRHTYFAMPPGEEIVHPVAFLILEGTCQFDASRSQVTDIRVEQSRGETPEGDNVPSLFSVTVHLDRLGAGQQEAASLFGDIDRNS